MAACSPLGGALSWGAGDFLAGLAARRLAVFTVLAVSQAIGLVGVALWVVLASDPFPGVVELLPAALAGIAGAIGLAALYRGLAVGAMGIVAPISAASPVVPLPVDAAQGVSRRLPSGSESRSSSPGSSRSRASRASGARGSLPESGSQ